MDSFENDNLDLSDNSGDTSSSSKSGLFQVNQPFVLELHDIKKDDPATERVIPEVKAKKKKRRSQPVTENKTGSTTSSSASLPATEAAGKEEFYDADGSYHDLAAKDGQAKPAAALALALQESEHNQDPKLSPEAPTRTSATPREPSKTLTMSQTALDNTTSRGEGGLGREMLPSPQFTTAFNSIMDKLVHRKSKSKKPAAKPKTSKKRQSDGPSCSMFLAEISRKLALKKRREEESPTNIVQTIIDSLTNALPVKFTKKSPSKKDSPTKIETLQTYAPELLPNDTLSVPPLNIISSEKISSLNGSPTIIIETPVKNRGFRIPKMPLVSSEVFKQPEIKLKVVTEDVAVNTGGEHDVASEIAKHVGTLRKISLIAEEFNQKTAKNLKEIVDSVQEDLLKKLEEAQAEERASKLETQILINEQKEPI